MKTYTILLYTKQGNVKAFPLCLSFNINHENQISFVDGNGKQIISNLDYVIREE